MTRSKIKAELDMKETFKKKSPELERRSAIKGETENQTTEQSMCGGFETLRIEDSTGSDTKSQTVVSIY